MGSSVCTNHNSDDFFSKVNIFLLLEEFPCKIFDITLKSKNMQNKFTSV